jgi:hypothetical protein
MERMEAIRGRRAVRDFKPDRNECAQIEPVIAAGSVAPRAGRRGPGEVQTCQVSRER